jgi:hypothetical protein
MRRTFESTSRQIDPASRDCLARTRSAVLNVLVVIGLSIAVSGWVLRARAAGERQRQPTKILDRGLTVGLLVTGTASYLSRRIMGRRSALDDPSRRERRFFWAHLVPAILAALAAPLGLAYGWFVDPSLGAVIPFWVVPLALGFLALPREHELADFERPIPDGGASPR